MSARQTVDRSIQPAGPQPAAQSPLPGQRVSEPGLTADCSLLAAAEKLCLSPPAREQKDHGPSTQQHLQISLALVAKHSRLHLEDQGRGPRNLELR